MASKNHIVILGTDEYSTRYKIIASSPGIVIFFSHVFSQYITMFLMFLLCTASFIYCEKPLINSKSRATFQVCESPYINGHN